MRDARRYYWRGRLKPWLLLLPVVVILLIFFIYPLGDMLLRSVQGSQDTWTLKNYVQIWHQPVYFQVLLITFEISLLVMLVAAVLGYPLAYVLSRIQPRTAGLLMILVVVPYFTSVLVRTYAWMVLLGTQGLFNQLLMSIGLISTPVQLMYTRWAVVIGMSYILLPYMVLALYSVMRGIDTGLLHAAQSLGASRRIAFWRVFFPLSLPGLVAGGLLVFILSLGFFIAPAMLGGPNDTMFSMVIKDRADTYYDWGFASALSAILLVCTLVIFAVYERLVGLKRLFEARL